MDKDILQQKRFLGKNTPTEAVILATACLKSIPEPLSGSTLKKTETTPPKK